MDIDLGQLDQVAVQLSAGGTGTIDVRFFGGPGGTEWEDGAKFTFVRARPVW